LSAELRTLRLLVHSNHSDVAISVQPLTKGHIKNIMKNQTKTPTSNPQPAHKIRHGFVSASIWRNETEKGPMFNVTFQRAYKDGEVWKNSTSFGHKNLLVLGLIAARAFEWIGSQSRKPAQPASSRMPKDDVPF
jgi:hypothetical protein